jgi:hypothetical protein
LATITFQWQNDGNFESKSVLKLAGQTVNQSLKITTDKEGHWEKIVVESPRAAATVVREGETARITRKDKVETLKLKPGTVFFDSFGIAVLRQAFEQYDQAKGGKQTLDAFIIPGVIKELSLEKGETVERSLGGKDVRFSSYLCNIAGVDIKVWLDSQGKVVLADVPAQHATFVREGYERLRQVPEADPLLSTPKQEVKIDRKVGVPMRDGIKLSTDIYHPQPDGRYPVILIRTPYKKEMTEPQANYYARRGYTVAVQDCRGRFDSPGEWEAFIHEKQDGHDAVEWLAGRAWSNGKVGMIGGSYVGWVQWWAATQLPPHLVTIIPNVSPPDPFYNLPYEYGVFFMQPAVW